MKCCLIGSDHNHCFHLISSPQLKFCIIIASKISFGQCRTSPQPPSGPSSQTLGCPNANVSPPECIIWKLLHNKTSLDWVQSQSLLCWKSVAHPYSEARSQRTSDHPTQSLCSQATNTDKWNTSNKYCQSDVMRCIDRNERHYRSKTSQELRMLSPSLFIVTM